MLKEILSIHFFIHAFNIYTSILVTLLFCCLKLTLCRKDSDLILNYHRCLVFIILYM